MGIRARDLRVEKLLSLQNDGKGSREQFFDAAAEMARRLREVDKAINDWPFHTGLLAVLRRILDGKGKVGK